MSLYERVSAVSEQYNQIRSSLKAVEHAPEELRSHEAHLSDLQKQLANTIHRLQELGKLTQRGRERHERYRDSTIRRLVYRATGKGADFQAKADRELGEYYRALEKEKEVKAEKETLETEISEAMNDRKQLQAASSERSRLHDELESIYEELFKGPTVEFPEENAQREATKAAESQYEKLNGQLDNTHDAAQYLAEAQLTIKEAALGVYEALRLCERDMGFGRVLADIREQNCLTSAQKKVRKTQGMVSRAMRLDPKVQSLPPLHIAQRDMISSILFDNVLFNSSYFCMVQQSLREVLREVKAAEAVLGAELRGARSRESNLLLQVEQAARDLKAAQQKLRRIREEAFRKAADPPPPYTEQPANACI